MAHPQHRPPFATVPLLLATGLLFAPLLRAGADTESGRWAVCPPPPPLYTTAPPASSAKPGQTELTADEATSQAGGSSEFRGHVVVQRDGRTLQGDRATYDQQSREVTVEGHVLFHGEGVLMQGESARMRMEEQSGEFREASFYLPAQHAFGSANLLTLDDADHSTLRGVRYTTCNPGQEDWLLSASELRLDQQGNTGEAFQTVLRFKGVPIFYSPYLNFPLAGRKSGLLFPLIGTSDSNGTDIGLPIYWNIAPNADATFTPRNLTARGPMLMSEFRHLSKQGESQIHADYLGNDKIFGDDRHYLALDHTSRFAQGWSSTLLLRDVSDPLYLDDLGADGESSTTHLERRLDLNYRDAHWNFLARAQSYQTLSGAEPYQRLPQLQLNGQSTRRPNRPQLTLQGEAVNFAHESTIPTGQRLDLKPAVTLPLQGDAWFLTPSAAWRHTDYTLNDHAAGEHLSRSLPILSLDSGLFFERETSLGGRAMTQTLEPRLFYLSVPYVEQDDLPLFDSADAAPSFSQLFRDNRFSGADRQGDARQLTTALTSRLLDDESGRERLRVSIGRIHYLADRQVTLNASEPDETAVYSDLFAELALQPSERLRIGIDGRHDTERDRNEQLSARLRYQPDAKRLLNLNYRYDESPLLRQSDALLFWPLARQWQWLARWRYDLEQGEDLELLAGVEYESCCWSLRLMGQHRRDTVDEAMRRGIYLTFQFKGLASLGKSIEETLGGDLLTYQ
ncbi:MAG: LPS assembly protein LptD [Gammaproteobacteria bacterium]|nr:LPS assembly protein LptD [Gammaproteobacteria bacterium]